MMLRAARSHQLTIAMLWSICPAVRRPPLRRVLAFGRRDRKDDFEAAIQEFRVVTNAYSADHGRAMGVVSLVTTAEDKRIVTPALLNTTRFLAQPASVRRVSL